MPLIESAYKPPALFKNPHLQTAFARALRRVPQLAYQGRRLTLSDGDFLDLDIVNKGNHRAAILLHGLESCSRAPYIRGMGQMLSREGWDIVAMNFRGCSGVPNLTLRSYHSGVTDDLQEVIQFVKDTLGYQTCVLVGFSLGGNVVLKYLGDLGSAVKDTGILAAAAISVPCDLKGCAEKFARPENRFYMKRFLKFLFRKVRHRQEAFPDALDYEAVLSSQNFHDFDGRFTAPIHGFESAEHYWETCSSKAVASNIDIPTLLLNARDDPFLTETCHLVEEASDQPTLHAETTDHGGHVGFIQLGPDREYYAETSVKTFLRRHHS